MMQGHRSMPIPRPDTYETFHLHALMPAPLWQAVFYDNDTEVHFLVPVHALALVSRRTLPRPADKFLPPDADAAPEIVALEYHPADGWILSDEDDNYCGLLPPEMTLEQFEAQRPCGHEPGAKEEHTP